MAGCLVPWSYREAPLPHGFPPKSFIPQFTVSIFSDFADIDSMEALNLAAFDQAVPLDLDPTIWESNLAALEVEQPDFAARLRETPIPPHWRPVRGLDDWPTWRIEPEGLPAAWLTATAAPRARAEALVRLDLQQNKNPALPTIAAGAELAYLLEKLTHQQAIYVFERNLPQLAAVLHVANLADAIRQGRFIPIPPSEEEAFLYALLERQPGLLPPGSLIALPGVEDPRIEEIRVLCERISTRVNADRNQRLSRLTIRDVTPLFSLKDPPGLAVLAFGVDPATYRLAESLVGSSTELGWRGSCHTAIDPRQMHREPHIRILSDFGPNLALAIGHSPDVVPLPAQCVQLQWHLHRRDATKLNTSDKIHHLTASPAIDDDLTRSNVPRERVHRLYWALPGSYTNRQSPSVSLINPDQPGAILVWGDYLDPDPRTSGIEQPTHKQLWQQLLVTASECWDTSDILNPSAIIFRAERACGVELREPSLRERMLRIIEHVLIPAVLQQKIIRGLAELGFDVCVVGKGWQRCSTLEINSIVDDPNQLSAQSSGADKLPGKQVPHPAAIFCNPLDPFQQGLFYAVGLRVPILLFNPGPKSIAEKLGGILNPDAHYQPFGNLRDLRAILDRIQTHPSRALDRAERVFEYAAGAHTYAHRLTALLDELKQTVQPD